MNGNKAKVLIVDDDDEFRETLGRWLEDEGYEVIDASNPEDGQKKLFSDEPHLIFLDLRFPPFDETRSFNMLKDICSQRPDIPVIMITNYGDIPKAVNAIKIGAYDFIQKPPDYEKLRVTLRNALDKISLYRRAEGLEEELVHIKRLLSEYPDITGKSRPVVEVLETINRVADSDSTVLITGESGTGKELVAHALHKHSSRAEKPFVTVNCPAFPEGLLESELFGYEKGAFTDAHKRKLGRFELADKGTLFLDEVGDMALRLQAKLLRAIETKKIERLGGTRTIPVDVRIIAATNHDLQKDISEGSFREDLYHRLNVITIKLPPLPKKAAQFHQMKRGLQIPILSQVTSL